MKKLMTVILAAVLLFVSAMALADPVSEVWTCKLNDGKTAEDAQAVNSKWLAWARKVGGSDEIISTFATPVVGDSGFIWVDTYPDLLTWAKVSEASTSDDYPMGDEFEELQTCSGNRLWSGAETK